MPQVFLDIPEKTYQHIERQAQTTHLSIQEFLKRQIIQDFGFPIDTPRQAKQRTEEWLHAHAGMLLKAGKPSFEKESQEWLVPVLTNVPSNQSDLIREIHIDAQTGDILESEDIIEILEKTRQAFGLSRIKPEQQARLNELLELNKTKELTPQEKEELDWLMQQVQEQTDSNLERLESILSMAPIS